MGSLAEQLMNGVTSMTRRRSRMLSRVRELMMAGTVQPKPRIMGMNARPESPRAPMMPSMT